MWQQKALDIEHMFNLQSREKKKRLMRLIKWLIRLFNQKRFEMNLQSRRDYYRNEYLKSDAWKRKRYVVLKRDNWRCVHCGARATQVHHKR